MLLTWRAGSKRVLTTGRDNTLRFYDGAAGMKQTASAYHNNNTGRWVMPFRATWGPGGTAVCGSMKRAVRSCVLAIVKPLRVSTLAFITLHEERGGSIG